MTEVEAYEAPPPPATVNVALASAGAMATASSTHTVYPFSPGAAIDGEPKGLNWGSGGGWHSATGTFPQWLQIDFNGSKTIDEIDVYNVQDNYGSPSEPTETMTFSLYGLTGYEVQYWNGSTWVTVPGGSVASNNKVWKKIVFTPVTTTKIRVLTNASIDGYSRLTEVEAWTVGSGSSSANVKWLVADQLGTPRMVFDQSGSLANMSRHDYLPFGEEIYAGAGGRSSSQGYTLSDNVRQKFTSKERDNETGLDYFGARYYGSLQGRFTCPDPLLSSGTVFDPQTWNRYSYVLNNPLAFIDPLGLYVYDPRATQGQRDKFEEGFKKAQEALKGLDPKSAEYKKLKRSLDAFGAKGVDNGVTVKFGTNENGAPAATEVGIRDRNQDGIKDITADNPTGQDIVLTIDPSQHRDSSSYATDTGHEGSHIADGSDLVAALPSNLSDPAVAMVLNGPLNLTKYQTEVRAYGVSATVSRGLGYDSLTIGKKYEIWNSGWGQAERATKQAAGIDRVLAEPKSKGGLYEVTSGNQGGRLIPEK